MIDIKELSESDLKHKIENIKVEREKTADALKRYEEELERRKQDAPLGVPSSNRVRNYYCVTEYGNAHGFSDDDDSLDKSFFEIMNYFSSKKSAEKHAEMLSDWRKTLVANAKGEPIDIKVLCPLLPKGWVACGKDGKWRWLNVKPHIESNEYWIAGSSYNCEGLFAFNLKPAEDWRNSLMECGL